jgi:hypothetical protein
MSGLLFGVGAAAVVVGAVMIGFGIPINEFSFGNTLIVAGTTAAVGGLVVIGLGVVVAHLQRIAEALATRASVRFSQSETFDAAAGSRAVPAQGRTPFQTIPKSESGMPEPYPGMAAPAPAYISFEERAAQSFASALRYSEKPPVTVEEEVSLSPQQAMAASNSNNGSGMAARRNEPTLSRRPPPPVTPARPQQPNAAYFDTMWPAEAKAAKSSTGSEAKADPKLDMSPHETAAVPKAAEPAVPTQRPASAPRGVAILKSGIVDGMGYTLYVDGSIEAELPQGTLRFASINELRSYLEKNS